MWFQASVAISTFIDFFGPFAPFERQPHDVVLLDLLPPTISSLTGISD